MDNDYAAYRIASAERREAFEAYNTASARLQLAQIRERLAEIKSQYQPINSLLEKSMPERERMWAIAYFVVWGRLPEPPKED